MNYLQTKVCIQAFTNTWKGKDIMADMYGIYLHRLSINKVLMEGKHTFRQFRI